MATQSNKISSIHPSGFDFLRKLSKNNNREWFNAHKDEYLEQLALVEGFADTLLGMMNTHDEIETASGKKSLFRIYRDTRFSNDKTPYKTHWSGFFKRATKFRRGGYYWHIEQGKSFIGGGFWGPEAADLKRIRDDIDFDAAPLRKILKSKSFISNFGSLQGEQLKKMPRGYAADHEASDLLRYKQFLLRRSFTDKEVMDKGFVKEANATFKAMRPFFDHMSEVLSSNSNGTTD